MSVELITFPGMIPEMNHVHLSQIWGEDDAAFYNEAKDAKVPLLVDEDTTKTIFWLLMAEFANSTIANADLNQFKYRLFATIYRYAPTWAKRMEIQKKIRELTDEDIMRGAKQIVNKAEHPGTEPSTASLEELMQIQEQTAVMTKRDKLSAYNNLAALLETDVTAAFIDRFRPLFKKIVAPENPLLYENIIEEDEE